MLAAIREHAFAPLVATAIALVGGGAGWVVTTVVKSDGDRAAMYERMAAHEKRIEEHEASIGRLSRLELVVERTATNVDNLLRVVEKQDDDLRDLRNTRRK
jgi:predicted kinase